MRTFPYQKLHGYGSPIATNRRATKSMALAVLDAGRFSKCDEAIEAAASKADSPGKGRRGWREAMEVYREMVRTIAKEMFCAAEDKMLGEKE